MSIPRVAIVGRPNVGKSSLLNWLAHRRISVVDAVAGVTRDRVTHLMHEGDRYFELVDTGGIGIHDTDRLEEEIERQIQIGLDEADLLLFVVDGREGVVPLDEEVGRRLRRLDKPVLLVVNKCDSPKTDPDAVAFLRLLDAPLVITSVTANRRRDDLVEAILDHLPPATGDELDSGKSLAADPELKLAIVGRRNVGKSTFINVLADDERVITSEVPGTTRDSVDVRFEFDGKTFVAIDTPGVRKRKKIDSNVEFYGLVRSRRSIARADVVLMFFDSQETISRVDKQLVDSIVEGFKPCVLVVNKWDLARQAGMTTESWSEYLFEQIGTLHHAPVSFVTALNGRNAKKLINLSQSIAKQTAHRVPTSKVNRVVRAAIVHNPPPFRRNRRPKIYYATQVDVVPPTFVLKCNHPELFDGPWKRYLLSVLREKLPFPDVPIRLIFRPRQQDEVALPGLDEHPQPASVKED